MDGNGKRRSYAIPFIYAIFFICIATGGVLLVFYAFVPALSEPWQPAAAFLLIGSTWIFWFCTYIYSCIKHYLRRQNATRQPPSAQRQDSSAAASATLPSNAA